MTAKQMVLGQDEVQMLKTFRTLDREEQARLLVELEAIVHAPTCPPLEEVEKRAAAFWGWVDSRRAAASAKAVS